MGLTLKFIEKIIKYIEQKNALKKIVFFSIVYSGYLNDYLKIDTKPVIISVWWYFMCYFIDL